MLRAYSNDMMSGLKWLSTVSQWDWEAIHCILAGGNPGTGIILYVAYAWSKYIPWITGEKGHLQ